MPADLVIAEILAVRHGQSQANVVFPAADAAGRLDSGLTGRDADVELTDLGRAQAASLGRYLAALPADRRPEVVFTSPFRRARDTWALAAAGSGLSWPEPLLDDRLVDRAMGDLELLTRAAIDTRYPVEAARRAADPYGYRPPNGENFEDIRARLTAFLTDATRDHHGKRIITVAHDAVVLMLRAVIEGLDRAGVDAVEIAAGAVRNASVTRFVADHTALRLAAYNTVDHLATVTAGPDEG
jgi:probable phosphoglycerate mutase